MSVVSGSLSVVCPVPVRFLVRSLSVGCPVPSLSFVRRSPLIPDMKEPPPSAPALKIVANIHGDLPMGGYPGDGRQLG